MIIFNKSRRANKFPDRWKVGFITPIYKSGSKNEVSNYRAINILCAISKIFEKLVAKSLFEHVKGKIKKVQHGFFPKRSTETNLLDYLTLLMEATINGGQVDSIYTDFSKAFDIVIHGILLEKLKNFDIGDCLIEWMKSYLLDRTLYVAIGSHRSEKIHPLSGVPQGSVLGPLLFVLFINDMPEIFNAECSLFADDNKIFRKISSHQDCLLLQHDIDELPKWCERNGLDLNVKKCAVISFTRSPRKIIFNYELSGTSIERVSNVKDLGIIFDEKLSFNDHVNGVCKKAHQMLGFIFRACKSFSNISSILVLYKAYVRSRLEYCNSVWSPIYHTYCDKIERVQRKFTRMVFYKFNLGRISYDERLKLELLPIKSREKYNRQYRNFKDWQMSYGVATISEKLILA